LAVKTRAKLFCKFFIYLLIRILAVLFNLTPQTDDLIVGNLGLIGEWAHNFLRKILAFYKNTMNIHIMKKIFYLFLSLTATLNAGLGDTSKTLENKDVVEQVQNMIEGIQKLNNLEKDKIDESNKAAIIKRLDMYAIFIVELESIVKNIKLNLTESVILKLSNSYDVFFENMRQKIGASEDFLTWFSDFAYQIDIAKSIPIEQWFDSPVKVVKVDSDGNPVKVDSDGNPVKVDSDGNPVKVEEGNEDFKQTAMILPWILKEAIECMLKVYKRDNEILNMIQYVNDVNSCYTFTYKNFTLTCVTCKKPVSDITLFRVLCYIQEKMSLIANTEVSLMQSYTNTLKRLCEALCFFSDITSSLEFKKVFKKNVDKENVDKENVDKEKDRLDEFGINDVLLFIYARIYCECDVSWQEKAKLINCLKANNDNLQAVVDLIVDRLEEIGQLKEIIQKHAVTLINSYIEFFGDNTNNIGS